MEILCGKWCHFPPQHEGTLWPETTDARGQLTELFHCWCHPVEYITLRNSAHWLILCGDWAKHWSNWSWYSSHRTTKCIHRYWRWLKKTCRTCKRNKPQEFVFKLKHWIFMACFFPLTITSKKDLPFTPRTALQKFQAQQPGNKIGYTDTFEVYKILYSFENVHSEYIRQNRTG